jgi:hypothetical protein
MSRVRSSLSAQRLAQRLCQVEPLGCRQEAADGERAAVRAQHQWAVVIGRIVDGDPQPIRLKAPALFAPTGIMALDDSPTLQPDALTCALRR